MVIRVLGTWNLLFADSRLTSRSGFSEVKNGRHLKETNQGEDFPID